MADPISTIPGVSSGIDWASVVDAVITADKKPATRMQATLDANAKRKDALELFRQAMGALKTAADGLRTGKAFDAFTVSASGADGAGRSVLAAAVAGGALPGTTSVTVTALAAAQRTAAATGWTASKTLASDGTLTLGGKPVALKAGDSLATVRDRINAQASATGVQASILSTDGTGNDQRLVLTGARTGAANAFAVADGSGGALVSALGFDGTNVVDAADAAFTLDGGASVTRASNVVADAIPGVTLTLGAKGTSSVTVERRTAAGAEAVQAFVDAYNTVQSFAKSQGASGAPLYNDALVRTVRGALSGMTLTSAPLTDGAGHATAVASDLDALGRLGVSVQKDGSLAFDRSAFDAAYPSRMGDVKAVLADRMSDFFFYADGITGTYTGLIDRREAAMQDQNVSLQSRIDTLNARLDKKRTALLAQYAKFEASLGKLKALGDSMTAQFTALNNGNKSN